MTKLFALGIALLLMLCACGPVSDGEKVPAPSSDSVSNTEVDSKEDFPPSPDRIDVGVGGEKKELFPDSKEYTDVLEAIRGRVRKTNGLYYYLSSSRRMEVALAPTLRNRETFAEFIYDEPRSIDIPLGIGYGEIEYEPTQAQRLFFPLTGEYHGDLFVGKDSRYTSGGILGTLTDDTSLITYINSLF